MQLGHKIGMEGNHGLLVTEYGKGLGSLHEGELF
jgi:hypothetical protein